MAGFTGVRSGLAQTAQIDRWWLQQQRMLQTNLREIDATMDIDRYVREVKDFGATVILFNVGGIVANYPTELQYHYRNPHMQGDLVGTVLERLHKEGIRVIGRFDFSKINENFAAEKPEWLYVSEKGEHVNYNGQVHTCVSGGYQQEYMFEILGEAVDRYPLDGVFFNMIGYQRSDYSGNYHGICQCGRARTKFREFAGMELPKTQDENSPAYRKYMEFTRMMSDRQFHRVNAFLKAKRPDLAICTYTTAGVDIIRKESNTPLGEGTYADTDKAKSHPADGRRAAACQLRRALHRHPLPARGRVAVPDDPADLAARNQWRLAGFLLHRPAPETGGPHGAGHGADALPLPRGQRAMVQSRPAAPARSPSSVAAARSTTACCRSSARTRSHSSSRPWTSRCCRHIRSRSSPTPADLSREECAALDEYVAQGGKLLLTGRLAGGPRVHERTSHSNRPAPRRKAHTSGFARRTARGWPDRPGETGRGIPPGIVSRL